MNNCPNCGNSNRSNAKYCRVCGYVLNAPSDAPATPESAAAQGARDAQGVDLAATPDLASQGSMPGPSLPGAKMVDASPPPSPVSAMAESTAPSQEPAASSNLLELPTAGSTDSVAINAPQPPSGESASTPVDMPVMASAMVTAPTGDSPITDPLVTAPLITDPLITGSPTPLATGTVLQDRFTLLEMVSQAGDAITYRARDAWRCPACDFVNEADAVFCSNCGRELTERGTVLLSERGNSAELSPTPDFVLNGRAYQIQPDVAAVADATPSAPRVRLQFAAGSDVGFVRGAAREPNEDSAFTLAVSAVHQSVPHPTGGLFIVADGIGGSEAGEVASKKAIQVLSSALLNTVIAPVLQGEELADDTVREKIRAAILDAHKKVKELADEKHNDMGTTVTLALVLDGRAYIANVGDSRTYLMRDAKLAPVTQDHSLVSSLVSAKMITPEEAYSHPQRNIILRSLGGNQEPEVDVFPLEGGALPLQAGDRLLLCCDGLWEMVRDFDLESILLREPDLNKAAASMIAAANEGGGEDNITLIIVNFF